jgi:hypothetical protein
MTNNKDIDTKNILLIQLLAQNVGFDLLQDSNCISGAIISACVIHLQCVYGDVGLILIICISNESILLLLKYYCNSEWNHIAKIIKFRVLLE